MLSHLQYLTQLPVLEGIALAAIVHILVGMVWYSPKVFGSAWLKLSGVKPKQIDMGRAYVGAVVGSVLVAAVMSCLLHRLALNGYEASVLLAIKLWLGFVLPSSMGGVLWEGKPMQLFALHAGCHLVQLMAVGAVLSYFAY